MKKKEYIMSINPCIYGLNYHDPSVSIVADGEILIAIEEERINGIKGSKGLFPENAIHYCLDYCNIHWDDITCIVIGYSPELWNDRLNLELSKIITDNTSSLGIDGKNLINSVIDSNLVNRYNFFNCREAIETLILQRCHATRKIPIYFIEHHLAHIASSYETSSFKEAVGIVVDGIGESAVTSIWKISDHKYEKIIQIDYPNSLGYFYAIATRFLGFEPWNHEGKTMALAAYGHRNEEISRNMSEIIDLSSNLYNVSNFISRTATSYLMVDEEAAIKAIEKAVGFPARKPNDPITEYHKDFAWFVQNILEESIVNLVNHAVNLTGLHDVCVAGGIFMNCKMNMVVRENSLAQNYHVQPLAGDVGLVIGAGLIKSNTRLVQNYYSVDFGPEFSDKEIEQELIKENVKYIKSLDIASDVATQLAEGKVVCWFQGRMEMGARALGSRSILADPRRKDMSDHINNIVKHRETWRPFACSVLEDYCDSIFMNYDANKLYPFMIEAFKVKPEWIERIPAVIHKADGTSRPQTVSKKYKPLYYDMISHFMDLTNCPLVLNTSFNDKGQPIIMTPQKAVEFFKKIPVDILAIGNFIVFR